MSAERHIEKLPPDHNIKRFDCGREEAADIAGIRAFAVHAKDEYARNFYKKFDFIPSPTDPMHLFVLLKDVKPIIAGW